MSLIRKWKSVKELRVLVEDVIEADLRKAIDEEKVSEQRTPPPSGKALLMIRARNLLLDKLKQKIGLVDVGSLRSPTSNLSDGSEQGGGFVEGGATPFTFSANPSEKPKSLLEKATPKTECDEE